MRVGVESQNFSQGENDEIVTDESIARWQAIVGYDDVSIFDS